MSTIKVQDIQHTGNSNDAISLASDSSVALKHSGSTKLATSSTGVSITGTCTATTFSGSGASLTALPAANITGTLPAIDGSNLTGITSDLVNDTSPQLGGNLDVQSSEITTSTSNGNIKATPNGTGVFEVKSSGSVDGTLQLNCTVNSHGIKLRSPAHSNGQSYTIIFPDNNITADKYLKVKSISGSGATAIGQLEYASLDANDLGEGTIPDARFPATLPAASAANLTAIPAANITGTLPAINGGSLTDLNGSNISSGTVAAARVATLNQDTTGTAAIATTITVADESSDTTCFPLFSTDATGNLAPKSGSNLTFNSSTGILTATGFVGALTGTASGLSGTPAITVGLVTANSLDVSGDVDVDGTLEADAITVDGTALAASATTDTTNANNISSGTIPDARLPDPLPAISGANLTNLPLSAYAPLASPALTGTATAVNLTLSGNLVVNGTTTTIDSTNTTIADNLLELNSGASSNANDSGIIIERGSTGDNAIFAWDESADKFIVGTTTAVASDTGNLSITAAALVTSTVEDSKGNLRSIPQNTQGSTYTLVAADAGKHILASGTVTVPNNVFSAGDAVTIVNNTSGDLTITKTITTMYLGTDATSANRTLATRGVATILFASATVAYITGAGLS